MEVEMDTMSVENSVASGAGKGKAKGGKAKAPLGPSNSANVMPTDGRSVEEIYQKMTQLEHILLRPDTYIGSTEHQQQPMWVLEDGRMVQRTISFVPGLYKIFDEILVNAADNKVRDASMDTLKVDILPESNTVRVMNNGAGIPVEVHKGEGVYVPELIFGHLLTSSNYDDQQKKITGGRNGYGAKLANIFSTEFTVETADGSREKRYKQVFTQNMTVKGNPKITKCKASDNWTAVEFKPDLAKFGMTELEEETVQLMKKRVYDLAGVLGKGVKVYLNGQRIACKSFQEYVELYLGPKDNGAPRIYEKANDRWEVCISVSDGSFQQVSFANSICTYKGGTHVVHVTDQIAGKLVELISKKNKNAGVKANHVKNHLWVFVNSHIENPAFDSQTKENLTLKPSCFGSKCALSDAFLKKVANCGIMENILSYAAFKQSKELKKNDGAKRQRLVGIPKLDDANDAGGRNSASCTLILTEGDSAKTLAVSGLSVVGRDKYGIFPLRGKLLNVRDASHTQIMNNAEINNIKQILGLQHGKVYNDTKGLRYGHIMIMTDQDQDGSHIKGLIMNFIHHFYPSLLKVPGFLVEFITPIIKASKGRDSRVFYTLPEYESWRESLTSARGWSIKYYKGLGTSTAKEAKEYFAALTDHKKEFVWEGDEDGDSLSMAFSKKRVEDRKTWLREYQPGTFLDQSGDTISYSEFVHKELILFSRADLFRSIPSMVDGLKPGQRKILYSCFKRNLKSDIKVAQLSGYVAEHSAYHHGETSLASTIVGLAQDYCGSNNINLLVPSGQFGTRLQGGKDSASPRYIFTRLAPLARHIFNAGDDKLLNYLDEEGQTIEPEWYMPILPMVLINGADGIGTGWSTSIPNYNPRDIVANLKRLMRREEQVAMLPWYNHFKGSIEEVTTKSGGRTFQVTGVFEQSEGGLDITELPVRKWTQDYKEYLEALIKPENKAETPFITDYKEYHTDTTVHFSVALSQDKLAEAVKAGIEKKFKLQSTISTGNMMLWDKNGVIRKFDTPEEILEEFYDLRLSYYDKRRASLIQCAEADLQRLTNKMRFILEVIDGKMVVNNRKKKDIEADLVARGYDALPSTKKKAVTVAADPEDGDEEADAAAAAALSYDYLLSMPIWSLTLERVEALKDDADAQTQEVERLKSTTAREMWEDDLDAFLEALADKEVEDAKVAKQQLAARKRAGGGKARGKARTGDEGSESDDDWAPSSKAASKAAPAKRAPAARKAPAPKPKAAAMAAAAPVPVPESAVSEPEATVVEEADAKSFGSLADRLAKMKVAKATAPQASKPAPARAPRAAASKARSKAVMLSDDSESDAEIEVDDSSSESEGEPEIMSPHPAKKKAAAKKQPAAAAAKRKPAPKKKVASDVPPTPQPTRSGAMDYELESPSPAVAQSLKVRRMRESPFHKGSGALATTPAPKSPPIETVDEEDEDEAAPSEAPVQPAGGRRPARRAAAAARKTYVVEDSDEEDSEVEIVESDESDYNGESD
eukprot:jgi/Tetstr1/442852/TSEL_003229.t1